MSSIASPSSITSILPQTMHNTSVTPKTRTKSYLRDLSLTRTHNTVPPSTIGYKLPRPLTMSHTSNLPTSPPPLADATPGKLKRLSLASKPALGDVDRDVDAGIGAGVREGAGPSTPRRSGRGLRSSISYSPALVWSSVMPQREIGIGSGASRDGNVSGVRGSMDGFGRGGIREESPIERASAWSDTGRDGGEVREKQGGRRTQTLTDK